MDKNIKRKISIKKIAGFVKNNYDKDRLEAEAIDEEILKQMKKEMYFRRRVSPSELISPKWEGGSKDMFKRYKKKLRKQEEALGIKVLV